MKRRRYLQMLAGTGALAGLAGCNSSEDETPSPSATRTEAPTETPDPTPEPTPTSSDQAPSLVTATTTPQDNGQALRYQIVAEDDQGLEYVAVVYGDRKQEWDGEGLGKRVGKSGEFTDLGQPPEDGQVVFGARDSTGQETQEERYPDEQAPRLSTVQLQPTANAGEIHAKLQGEDNVGLEELQLLLDGQPAHQENVSGQSETSLNTTVDVSDLAAVGEENSLSALLEDWNGNTTENDSDTYVRKFNKMDDTRLDVGAVYIPFTGDKLQECHKGAEPAVGNYGDPIPPEISSRHIDQMQGHGINKVMFNFGEVRQDYDKFRIFKESSLFADIDVEIFYVPTQALKRGRDISQDLEFIKDNALTEENYSRVNGRPVIQNWAVPYLTWGGNEEAKRIQDQLEDDHGSLAGFVDYLRAKLTVDGTEPFIVADANKRGIYGFDDDYETFWGSFDGLTNWTGAVKPNETVSHDEALEIMQQEYEGIRKFAERHDQEFWPMVYPGFRDTHNECWGQDRLIELSPEFFEEMFDLASRYQYGNYTRYNISTFNAWGENPIEPGTFQGKNRGTAYLKVVKKLQQEGG